MIRRARRFQTVINWYRARALRVLGRAPMARVPRVGADFARRRLDKRSYVPAVPDREFRLKLIFYPALGWVVLVMGWFYAIQISDIKGARKRAEQQHLGKFQLASERGAILDRYGRVLAMSVSAGAVYVHPGELHRKVRSESERQQFAHQVAELLSTDVGSVQRAFNATAPFTFIQRQVPRGVAEAIEHLGIPGVGFKPESRRMYPYGHAAAVLIGRVGLDGAGLSGIERAYEHQLAKEGVETTVALDAHQNVIHIDTATAIDPVAAQEPPRGEPVQLTIDVDLQTIVEEELERGRITAGAKSAFGLMINAKTGELLAMGQSPTLNLNSNKRVQSSGLRNLAVEVTFEPGSILKAMVAAGALEMGIVSPNEKIDCEHGQYTYAGKIIKDTHPSDVITFRDVVARSSNIGMTKVGDRLGRFHLYDILRAFGFGQLTQIGIPGESAGIFRPVGSWAQVDVATHSYGHGIAVSPLQIVRAFGSLVNGGILMPLKVITDRTPSDSPRRVLSSRVADLITDMLYGVVELEGGTGSFAMIPGVRVGGKTGTAHKPRTGGYARDKTMSSFVGFVDASEIGIDDRLVLLVTLEEPTGDSHYGGIVSAPVFRKIMKRTLDVVATRKLLAPSGATALRRDGEPRRNS